MIVKWGRKGQFAGALEVTFVTPVDAPTSIHRGQHRPDIRFEFRHITPVAGTPSAGSIHRYQYRPDVRFEFKHLTPVAVTPSAGSIHKYQHRPDVRFEFKHLTPVDIVVIAEPATTVVEEKSVSGTLRKAKAKITRPILQLNQPLREDKTLFAQLHREDEEIISVVVALIQLGIIK